MKTIYHLAISRLKYNKGRSILTIVAIALMTTLLMSIGSSALTVIRHQQLVILSILVDTFISKISLTMQPGPKIDSISGA